MVRKEVVVTEVSKLMKNREFIRNMGIVAHVDHGKCVSGDTRIVLEDGRVTEARELFKAIATNGKVVRMTPSETVFDARSHNLRVFSLDKRTGNIEVKPLQNAWKLRGGRVLRVTLRNGVSLSTTPEHKYLVLGERGFEERMAEKLAVGDAVVCAKNLRIQTSEHRLKELFVKAISNDAFYVWPSKEFSVWLENEIRKLSKEEIRVLFTGLKPKEIEATLKKRRYRSRDFLKVCQRFNVPLALAYDKILRLAFRGGTRGNGKNAKPILPPKEFSGFFFLVGLLYGYGNCDGNGDGNGGKFHGDKFIARKPELAELGKLFTRELVKLGITPEIYRALERHRAPEISAGCKILGKTFLKLLNCLFEYPAGAIGKKSIGKKSHIQDGIHATEFLFAAPDECVASFLKGYFDCEGTIEQARRAISLSSASTRMLSDIQLFLLRFNVAAIKQDNTLYIEGNSIKRFNERIGFSLEEKRAKALALQEQAIGSYALDAVLLSSSALKALRGSASMENSMESSASDCYKYETKGVAPALASLAKTALKSQNKFLENLCSEQLAFVEIVSIEEGFENYVFDFTVADNHNFVSEGVFVHNTTLSDSLLARAGLISKELAGEQRVLDYEELEQQRGITIKAANVSLGFAYGDKDYLINLIDTPGHVDFGGHVTRAMRAVDGIILVVDAVETIMPQTETVLRQALREKVKPVLFINKIDRLVNELKLDAKAMQERFVKIIGGVNAIIDTYGPPEFKKDWLISVEKGNVAFGSAFNKWAISFTTMNRLGINFTQLCQMCAEAKHEELQKKAPLDEVILEMVVEHLPNPVEAQKSRVPVIWHGDLEGEHGRGMLACDPDGRVCFMITAIQVDPHAGEVAVGRLYSGTLKKGVELYLASRYATEKVQQVAVYMGPDRVLIDEVPAGNIAALVGLRDVFAGETASEGVMEPFEKIKHYAEPVVTKSIEAKNPRDLLKLIEVLRKFEKEDPTVRVEINQETGEHLISGMGELHLEIVEYKIQHERGVEITTSPPIVVYHEAITSPSPVLEGKSPNKHNKFKISVEPLEEGVAKAFDEGAIDEKTKGKELVEKLVAAGMPRDEAKNVLDIHNKNIFIDATKGVQYLLDIKESLIDGFEEAVDAGPLAKEKCTGVKVKLLDATIHVDPAHRGPAQIIPAVRRPIYACMLQSGALLLEPKQKLLVTSPADYMSPVVAQIQGRRGQIIEIGQEGNALSVNAKVPVAEMFGFSNEIRSATQGRAVWYYEYAGYERLPRELQEAIIRSVRKRKGEPEVPPQAKDFMD